MLRIYNSNTIHVLYFSHIFIITLCFYMFILTIIKLKNSKSLLLLRKVAVTINQYCVLLTKLSEFGKTEAYTHYKLHEAVSLQ